MTVWGERASVPPIIDQGTSSQREADQVDRIQANEADLHEGCGGGAREKAAVVCVSENEAAQQEEQVYGEETERRTLRPTHCTEVKPDNADRGDPAHPVQRLKPHLSSPRVVRDRYPISKDGATVQRAHA